MSSSAAVSRLSVAASRRSFLTAAAALAASPAAALSLSPLEGSALKDYVDRCEGVAATSDAANPLAGPAGRREIDRLAAEIRAVGRCPLCGCAVRAADAAEHLNTGASSLGR